MAQKSVNSKRLAWMDRSIKDEGAVYAESKPEHVLRFEAETLRQDKMDEERLENIQHKIEDLLEARASILEPVKDEFPNGSLFILGRQDYSYAPYCLITKDDEGVWYYNQSVVTWKQVQRHLIEANMVRQVTEYVTLPSGEAYDSTGKAVVTKVAKRAYTRKAKEPEAVVTKAKPVANERSERAKKAAVTRAANKAAKAAEAAEGLKASSISS